MYCVFEHEVDEVGCRLDKFVQLLKVLQLAPLALVKDVKVVLRGVEFHVLDLGCQICLLLSNLLISLLQLLLFLLERANLLIDLLLHHLIEVLLLYFELFHNSSERLLEAVDFVIELFADLQLQFRVQFFAGRRLILVYLNLVYHLLDHALHIKH